MLMLLALLSCSKVPQPAAEPPKEEEKQEQPQEESSMPDTIQMTIAGQTLPVSIEHNDAAEALVTALRNAPITFTASDYGGFEKVGPLGRSLPTANSQITTQAGDVMLYNGDQIVLFYGSNSWSYTRLGKILYGSLDELKSFLHAGEGNISVLLSLIPGSIHN